MSPFEPFAITTFCDDIRYELGGKYSLVGIYRDDIVLQGATFPTALPKLALSVTLILHPSHPVLPMDVKISLPGDPDDAPQFVARIDAHAEPDPTAPVDRRRILNFHFILAPVTFKEPGSIKVRLHQENRIIKAGTLIVRSVETQDNPMLQLANPPPAAA